jgi:hypothetical protein
METVEPIARLELRVWGRGKASPDGSDEMAEGGGHGRLSTDPMVGMLNLSS